MAPSAVLLTLFIFGAQLLGAYGWVIPHDTELIPTLTRRTNIGPIFPDPQPANARVVGGDASGPPLCLQSGQAGIPGQPWNSADLHSAVEALIPYRGVNVLTQLEAGPGKCRTIQCNSDKNAAIELCNDNTDAVLVNVGDVYTLGSMITMLHGGCQVSHPTGGGFLTATVLGQQFTTEQWNVVVRKADEKNDCSSLVPP